MTAQYIVGTLVQLEANFTDSVGTPADPDEVTAEIRLPDGTTEDLSGEVVKTGTGAYRAPFTPSMNGLHEYRFAGTGNVIAAGESFFLAQTVFPEE